MLMQGFVSRDRRKAHVREADEKLLEAMAEQPEAEEGEPSPGGHAPLLADVVRDDAQFEALVKTARVLLACGRAAQAAQLVEDSILHFGRRWQDRLVTACLRAYHNNQTLSVCDANFRYLGVPSIDQQAITHSAVFLCILCFSPLLQSEFELVIDRD